MVKNMSQFKKAIGAITPYKVVEHYIHPEYSGQIRIPNVIQTNGFYSHIRDKRKNAFNCMNCGKGIWTDFYKAKDAQFCKDGTIVFYRRWKPYWAKEEIVEPVMKIRFLEEGE